MVLPCGGHAPIKGVLDSSFPHRGPPAVLSHEGHHHHMISSHGLDYSAVLTGGVWGECIKVCLHLFCGWLVPSPQFLCLFKSLFIYFKEPKAGSAINHPQEMNW